MSPLSCLTFAQRTGSKGGKRGNFPNSMGVHSVEPTNVKKQDLEEIDQTLAGDDAAFERLVIRYQERLFNTIAQMVGCKTEAEDVVQDAFVQAYVKLSTFRRDSAFYTWLYRIAMNVAISRRRRKRPTLSVEQHQESSGEEPLDGNEAPTERLERDELRTQVHEALGRLNEQYRAILVLREMEGFCYEEISEILELPIGTVRSRLHRARSQLKEELAPHVFDPQTEKPSSS